LKIIVAYFSFSQHGRFVFFSVRAETIMVKKYFNHAKFQNIIHIDHFALNYCYQQKGLSQHGPFCFAVNVALLMNLSVLQKGLSLR